jgi:predicted metal-dependent enzyme (double-stranded beta helix superfamily)
MSNEGSMDIRTERDQKVRDSIDKIRIIEGEGAVSPDRLEAIKSVLLDLAADRSLFPLEHFPIDPETDGNGVVYRLAEDADQRFALYASTALPGKGVSPHNHTTWAVIVGVHGEEHNIFYARTDDGSVAGQGTVEPVSEETVCHGSGVTLMPEDIHSIHVNGDTQTVHLHMYGLALEQLHDRVMYDRQLGTYKNFPATQNIKPV